ncbi:MAG: hypothetical protein LBG48_01645, partial [Rickettsiales bacterium]|nr:hypothetical protein [Rickettsiales bacterium]
MVDVVQRDIGGGGFVLELYKKSTSSTEKRKRAGGIQPDIMARLEVDCDGKICTTQPSNEITVNGAKVKGKRTLGGLWVKEGIKPEDIQTLVNSEEPALGGRKREFTYLSLTACATSELNNVRLLPPNISLPSGDAVDAIRKIKSKVGQNENIIIYCGCTYHKPQEKIRSHATALYCRGQDQDIEIYDPSGAILADRYKDCRDKLTGEFKIDFRHLEKTSTNHKLPQGKGGTCSFHTEAFIELASEYINNNGTYTFDIYRQHFHSDDFLLESARKVTRKVSRNTCELTDNFIERTQDLKAET